MSMEISGNYKDYKNQTVRKCNGSCLQCPAADRKDHGHAARLRFRHRFSAVPAAGQP